MATITVTLMTNDKPHSVNPFGNYEVKVFAGLNENPEEVMKKALERLQISIQSIPEKERYQGIPVAFS